MTAALHATEAQIQRAILDWLMWHGILAFRVNAGMQFVQDSNGSTRAIKGAPAGTSDIIGMTFDGKFLAIECKTATGKVTDKQQAFIDRVNAHGGIAFVARSVDDVEGRLT